MFTVIITLSHERFAKPDYRLDVDGKSFAGAAANAMRHLALEEAAFIRVELPGDIKAGFFLCKLTEVGFSYNRQSY